ncbi:hypothetical protein [Olsenella profusa]|uniref:hypothetical protein n=1 Tax=Olsenella profusa TaxID=138595 RepID=UPI00058F9E37|nr:hypothetical protein [Olsenella profusa]
MGDAGGAVPGGSGATHVRTCRRCGRTLPVEYFYHVGRGRDTVCSGCRRRYAREWYRTHAKRHEPLGRRSESAAASTPAEPRGRWAELVELGERRTREYLERMEGKRMAGRDRLIDWSD